MLDDIALFIQVVRHGSLSAAAQHLDLPPATVTRRLQKLEQQIGSKLLHRSARQFALTHEGEVYYRAYAALIEEFETTHQQLDQELRQLTGKLRVLAPTNFSNGILRPMWLAFTQSHPDIELELILGNELEDMVKTKADIAVRIGRQPDSLLYQQKIGEMDTVLVASPRYLQMHGNPNHPSDIKDHRVIGTTLRIRWSLIQRDTKTPLEIFPRFSALSNDLSFVKHMALDDQGIARLPITEVKEYLDSGELLQVLTDWQGEVREVFAVWPSGKLLSKKAQSLREHIKAFLKTNL